MQRKDDTVEALVTRMASYNKTTSPILDYYRSRNILFTLNATAPITEVSHQIDSAIYKNML